MDTITFPLEPGMQGPQVANLQDGLLLLLRQDFYPLSGGDVAVYVDELGAERGQYGQTTEKLVAMFQEMRQLPMDGKVDPATAGRLNQVLEELGAFEPEPAGPGDSTQQWVVAGVVHSEAGKALAKVRVRAYYEGQGARLSLGEDTTDYYGGYTIRYNPPPGGTRVDLLLGAYDTAGKPLVDLTLVENAGPLESVDLTVPAAEPPIAQRRIEGTVRLDDGRPGEQVRLRLYRREFGGGATLVDETTSLAGGQYAFTYDGGGRTASLQVRAVKETGEEIDLSKPVKSLGDADHKTLNLVAPAALKPLAGEYQRLAAALTPHVGHLAQLAEARENAERQDLTVLNRATGWDARLIGLAAMSERLCADPEVGLPREAVYGLLRAGLPSDKLLLAQVDAQAAGRALVKARSAGLIDLDDGQIDQVKDQFQAFTNRVRLSLPAPGSGSSYGTLLQSTGLSEDVQARFASVYLNHRGDAAELWESAARAGLSETEIGRLQVHGKLAFLAGNSELMTAHLLNQGITTPAELVDQGLFTAGRWKAEITAVAGDDTEQLATLIPATFVGEKVEDRLAAYAEDMARKVRMSYPTQVVTSLVEQDDDDAFRLGAVRGATAALLKTAAARGFRLGQTPVGAFFDAPAGTPRAPGDGDTLGAVEAIKTLHRLYQITPANEAMPVLRSLGITSAYDVTSFDEPDFVEAYAGAAVAFSPPSAWHKWYSSQWSGWHDLGGSLASGLAAASWGPRRLDLFARGTDDTLWHKSYDEAWSEWESLQGELTSAPAAVSWADGRIDVFARGAGNDLLHRWYQGAWSSWQTLAGSLASAPTVSSWGAGRLDVFARGPHNELLHNSYDGTWSGWQSLQGKLTSAPAAVSWGNGRLDVFARGTDHDLLHKSYEGSWSDWESLGGILLSAPAVASWASGRLDVFARGTGNTLLHKSYNGEWSDWKRLDGLFADDPAAVSLDSGHIDVFVRGLGRDTREEARLIFHKARQVSSVTYNIFSIAKTLESSVSLTALTAPAEVRERVRHDLIKHFPTMESLFGSMDFCECEHCRSVLSPAAYLVDLLQFLEAEPPMWDRFLAKWEQDHGQAYTHSYARPYDALVARRPDLVHIPLTCENTNTALPYIDLVNEILEYYVAHQGLAEEAARDTGGATTAELLAEPQNVIREAYDEVLAARYPLTLPFDLWLETVRQFCDYFETPLARVLEVFRPGEELFAPTQAYDRPAILAETLGLSPAEWALFGDPDPLSGERWIELYGYIRAGVQEPTNTGQATLTLADAAAARFEIGDRCAVVDAAANALRPGILSIAAIGSPGSGGDGRTLVTFEGVWPTLPNAGDLRILDVPGTLKSAKALSRRLGVTYKEMVDIVKTGFVNPRLEEIVVLHKLGLGIGEVLFCRELERRSLYDQYQDLIDYERGELGPEDQARFDSLSPEDWNTIKEIRAFDRRIESYVQQDPLRAADLEGILAAMPLDQILVLADPDAGCNFDETTLRYANGAPAGAIAFQRINLFVRLWRKLGWSLAETDYALQVFVPRDARYEPANLDRQPLQTALIYLAHLKALNELVKTGPEGRLKLATLWADIPTLGERSLYARLFLTRSVLHSDAVFDHPLGRYLADETVYLKDHLLALQGALGLTAGEIGLILADAGLDLDTARLTLPNVSLLYRYGLLAKGLKLSVAELIALKELSGLDPFTPLHPVSLTTLAEDYPFSQTLRFVEIAGQVQASGLDVQDLDYLLRHRFDPTGKYRPDRAQTLALIKTMADGIGAIRAEHAVPADPAALSDDLLRQKLGLALPADVAGQLLVMLDGTVEFTAVATGVSEAGALDPALFAGTPGIVALSPHNAARQEQKLTYRGVLFAVRQGELERQFSDGPTPRLTPTQQQTFHTLLTGVREAARTFFEKHLVKQPAGVVPAYGFLDDADYGVLFDRTLTAVPDEPELERARREQEQARRRRGVLAGAFLPFLQARLVRQFVVHTMAAHTGADPALVDALLTDARLLRTPPAAGGRSLLETLAAAAERGVTVTFFASPDGTGAPLHAAVTRTVAGTGPLPPGANSARLEGYLAVLDPGAYRFLVRLDKADAEATLRLAHLPAPTLTGRAEGNGAEVGHGPTEFAELKPGSFYRFRLDLRRLNGGGARLLVQGETTPKDGLERLPVYPVEAVDGAERALTLLAKALQLVQALELSEREARYLATHPGLGADLSALPTTRSGNGDPERQAAVERFDGFLRLAAYARLRRDLAPGTGDLIDVFEAQETGGAAPAYLAIARLARRDEAAVRSVAERLSSAPDVTAAGFLPRLWAALQIVDRFGVPAATLVTWTDIVGRAATAEQRFAIARDLREAIKARFEPGAWRRVAQPIFDRLRGRQRDALAAHVMHQKGYHRLEQLYEYFLIDPGMEPVVHTSRIRLAIGSVQLFVQRCLLNLEAQVHPAAILNSGQWEWMKRYRVWEANRKIFLFPENWLEPEFRDDKSHLYRELESALLEGDVSNDLVEDAFLNYLQKLEELARLDIVAMHLEENVDPARNVLHVFGRTYSEPHKYFYRRYAHQVWSPWEPVTAQVQGDHLAPVVWRDRLYLFWVTFLDKEIDDPVPSTEMSAPLTEATMVDITRASRAMLAYKTTQAQLHWSEYVKGEWSGERSGGYAVGDAGTITRYVRFDFDPRTVFVHVSKEPLSDGVERGVFVHLSKPMNGAFYLAGRNSAVEEREAAAAPLSPYATTDTRPTYYVADHRRPGPAYDNHRGHRWGAGLGGYYHQRLSTDPGQPPREESFTILKGADRFRLLLPNNELTLLAPPDLEDLAAGRESAVQEVIRGGLKEVGRLMKPFFFQDQSNTLFVEPSVTERTVEDWQEWVVRPPAPESTRAEAVADERPWDKHMRPWVESKLLKNLKRKSPAGDGDPQFDPSLIYDENLGADWLTNSATVLTFDEELIGPAGKVEIQVLPAAQAAGVLAAGGSAVKVQAGSEVAGDQVAVLAAGLALDDDELADAPGGLNVVGTSGMNSGLANNLERLEAMVLNGSKSRARMNGRR